MTSMYLFYVVCYLNIVLVFGKLSLLDNLKVARNIVTNQLQNISTIWEIEKYPKFLKSCQMHKSSWVEMKLRFMSIIVSSAIYDQKKLSDDSNKFVISFTGSSVAAGHDSRFEQAYPQVTGEFMHSSFSALNINLIVRNVAHGNNPCMPYDSCVATIAGLDSDIVHWEQSFNCVNPSMHEQFARQAYFMPKKPLVIYSESQTANW